MDIESKRYHVRTSGISGQVEILCKSSGRLVYVTQSDLPSVKALADMPESKFDKIISREMK